MKKPSDGRHLWQSSYLSYLVWRYAPFALLVLLAGMFAFHAAKGSDSGALLATLRRMVGEGGIRVRKGSAQTFYSWGMLRSLSTVKLKSTRFWWLRVQDEPAVLFMTDHSQFGLERADPLIQEIRRHMAEAGQ